MQKPLKATFYIISSSTCNAVFLVSSRLESYKVRKVSHLSEFQFYHRWQKRNVLLYPIHLSFLQFLFHNRPQGTIYPDPHNKKEQTFQLQFLQLLYPELFWMSSDSETPVITHLHTAHLQKPVKHHIDLLDKLIYERFVFPLFNSFPKTILQHWSCLQPDYGQ